MTRLEKIHGLICNTLFTIEPPLTANKLPKAFQTMVKLIQSEPLDSNWHSIGEFSAATIEDLIVGAYWFYSENYCGQASEEYATMCVIGSIFDPGRTRLGKGTELEVYQALEKLE